MITNDHYLGPIVQWLQYLKDNNLIVDPKLFTIDCSTAETNATGTIFPGCQIQYCLFHVSQAWYRQLNTQVKYSGSAADDRMVRGEVMASLKTALYKENIPVFLDRVNAFVTKYENSQPDFVKYFVDNWFNTAKYRVWSRAFHQLEFSHMLTNNYIESWHKKLKTCFLGRSRNKRLDCLVYILTDDVELYYKGEARRVITGSGPTTKSQKQQRRIEMTAEAIPGHMRENMIISPTKSTISDQDDGYDNPDFAEDGE